MNWPKCIAYISICLENISIEMNFGLWVNQWVDIINFKGDLSQVDLLSLRMNACLSVAWGDRLLTVASGAVWGLTCELTAKRFAFRWYFKREVLQWYEKSLL